MAVLIEAISVVISREAIRSHFCGGEDAFIRTIPNRAACNDDELFRVGFMDSTDADSYVDLLVAGGLTFVRDGATADLAIVIQRKGPSLPSPWLVYRDITHEGMKLNVCWQEGVQPTGFSTPAGWTYERSLSAEGPGFMPMSAIGERMKFLRRQNDVEVYLDLQTGKEVYAARPKISGDTAGAVATQVSAIWHDANTIDAQGPIPQPRVWRRSDPRLRKLKEELLPAIERIVAGPGSEMAGAHFTHGVVLRLLGRRDEAVKAFLAARDLSPGTLAFLRDLVRCLGEMQRSREALPYAREAGAIDPTDVAALGNLAACLMQCGEHVEARQVIQSALEIDPNDEINRAIRQRLNLL